MIYIFEMVIFHSYVSLEGISPCFHPDEIPPRNQTWLESPFEVELDMGKSSNCGWALYCSSKWVDLRATELIPQRDFQPVAIDRFWIIKHGTKKWHKNMALEWWDSDTFNKKYEKHRSVMSSMKNRCQWSDQFSSEFLDMCWFPWDFHEIFPQDGAPQL